MLQVTVIIRSTETVQTSAAIPLSLQCCHLANTCKLLISHSKCITQRKTGAKRGTVSSDGHQHLTTWYLGHAPFIQKFHQISFITFLVSGRQTHKQTDKQTDPKTLPPSSAEVIILLIKIIIGPINRNSISFLG